MSPPAISSRVSASLSLLGADGSSTSFALSGFAAYLPLTSRLSVAALGSVVVAPPVTAPVASVATSRSSTQLPPNACSASCAVVDAQERRARVRHSLILPRHEYSSVCGVGFLHENVPVAWAAAVCSGLWKLPVPAAERSSLALG